MTWSQERSKEDPDEARRQPGEWCPAGEWHGRCGKLFGVLLQYTFLTITSSLGPALCADAQQRRPMDASERTDLRRSRTADGDAFKWQVQGGLVQVHANINAFIYSFSVVITIRSLHWLNISSLYIKMSSECITTVNFIYLEFTTFKKNKQTIQCCSHYQSFFTPKVDLKCVRMLYFLLFLSSCLTSNLIITFKYFR